MIMEHNRHFSWQARTHNQPVTALQTQLVKSEQFLLSSFYRRQGEIFQGTQSVLQTSMSLGEHPISEQILLKNCDIVPSGRLPANVYVLANLTLMNSQNGQNPW